jgi:hypothetical protein
MRLKKLDIFVEGNSFRDYIISVRGSSYVGAESSLRDWGCNCGAYYQASLATRSLDKGPLSFKSLHAIGFRPIRNIE